MGCTLSSPPAPPQAAAKTFKTTGTEKEKRASLSNGSETGQIHRNASTNSQQRRGGRRPSVNMGSKIRVKSSLNITESWVHDDGGLKTHLARVNKVADLEKKYVLGQVLGEGLTGTVSLCKSKPDGATFALKSLNMNAMDEQQIEELRAEIEMLKLLDHPNIVALREVFESDATICIVMDYCNGGDLSKRRFANESQVAYVFYQIFKAVAHCHNKAVCHRDMKLENVMFVNKESLTIRVIDFGLSKVFRSTVVHIPKEFEAVEYLGLCGTPNYYAPEMLESQGSSDKADIWACGIMAYVLLTGSAPYLGDEDSILDQLRRKVPVSYEPKLWTRCSDVALDFVQHLLDFDPATRFSAKQALQHPWLQRVYDEQYEILKKDQDFLQRVNHSILDFCTYPMLKRAALMIMAHRADPNEMIRLRELFLAIDCGGTGRLSPQDLFAYCTENVKRDDSPRHSLVSSLEGFTSAVFSFVDTDKSGGIECMEFLSATIESQMDVTDWSVAFRHLDADGSGTIDEADVFDLLGSAFSEEEVREIMRSASLPLVSEEENLGGDVKQEDGLKQEDFVRLMEMSRSTSPATPSSSAGKLQKPQDRDADTADDSQAT